MAIGDLASIIKKYIDYSGTSNLLITGVPGIGKTTLLAKIAYIYKENDRVIILRFRDWDRDELERGLLNAICKTLECKRTDLENRVLVLDGFDEIKALDIGRSIISNFLIDIKDFYNLKCIVTSRPYYIRSVYFDNFVKLEVFNMHKVCEFYENITGNTLKDTKKIELNLDVLGIPVILYMAIMSNVDISNNPTKPELYNRIFAERGGIFDKFYDGMTQYDKGNQPLRNPVNTKEYLKFLRNTAFKMFEENTLTLLRSKREIPKLEFQGKRKDILDFPIKHLFEGTKSDNIEFIHKSIYEYFFSEYIFTSMRRNTHRQTDLAGVLGDILKSRELSDEILDFLGYRINNSSLNRKINLFIETFNLMLKDGMTYYTRKCYKNVINYELIIFKNMLEIIHLWHNNAILGFDPHIQDYLRYNNTCLLNLSESELGNIKRINLGRVDLRKVDLRKIDLSRADLRKSDLRGVDLKGENLKGADLREVDLRGANLSKANLTGIDLSGTDLRGANLSNTIFDENQVKILKDKYNLRGTKIYLNKKRKEIKFEHYKPEVI